MTDSPTTINPALRERAEIIIKELIIDTGSLHDRLLQLLVLSEPDLEILFTQRAVNKFERHNDFDIVFEMLSWKIPFAADLIDKGTREAIAHALETKNWKGAVALLIRAVDNV